MSGHGTLREGKLTTIPPQTYVLFNSSSGLRSTYPSGSALPYTDFLISDSDSAFYTKMLDEIRNPRTFLKTYEIGSGSNVSAYYPDITRNTNFSTSNPHLSQVQTSRAIYEPGTLVHDMNISFKNVAGQRELIIGLYKLPITPRILAPMQYFPGARGTRVSDEELTAFDLSVFRNPDFNNLAPDVIQTEQTLSSLFKRLPPIPTGKHRFLFITSCRGIETVDATTRTAYTGLARRMSVGSREGASARAVAEGRNARLRLEEGRHLRKVGLLEPSDYSLRRSGPLPALRNTANLIQRGVPMNTITAVHRAITRATPPPPPTRTPVFSFVGYNTTKPPLHPKEPGAPIYHIDKYIFTNTTNTRFRPRGVSGPVLGPSIQGYNQHGPWPIPESVEDKTGATGATPVPDARN